MRRCPRLLIPTKKRILIPFTCNGTRTRVYRVVTYVTEPARSGTRVFPPRGDVFLLREFGPAVSGTLDQPWNRSSRNSLRGLNGERTNGEMEVENGRARAGFIAEDRGQGLKRKRRATSEESRHSRVNAARGASSARRHDARPRRLRAGTLATCIFPRLLATGGTRGYMGAAKVARETGN